MELRDELERYLSTDPENVTNVIAWWHEHRAMYPCLSRMALDYCISQFLAGVIHNMTIRILMNHVPATSVDVERVFSHGRFTLSYTRSRMSAQTTRALLCLLQWSLIGYVHDIDVLNVAALPELAADAGDSDGEYEMEPGWDRIE